MSEKLPNFFRQYNFKMQYNFINIFKMSVKNIMRFVGYMGFCESEARIPFITVWDEVITKLPNKMLLYL